MLVLIKVLPSKVFYDILVLFQLIITFFLNFYFNVFYFFYLLFVFV